MVFQKILLVPIPFVQRKKPISKRANQTPNDSVFYHYATFTFRNNNNNKRFRKGLELGLGPGLVSILSLIQARP